MLVGREMVAAAGPTAAPATGGEIVSGVLFLAAGLLLAHFGARIWKWSVFAVGAIIGAVAAGFVGLILGTIVGPSPILCAGVGAFVGILLGGYLALSFGRLLIVLGVAAAGFIFGYKVLQDVAIAAVLFLVLFIMAYLMFEKVLALLMAFLGGAIAGVGVGDLLRVAGQKDPTVLYAEVAVALAVIVSGAMLQMRSRDRPASSPKNARS